MIPYIGKKYHGSVCKYGCCFMKGKYQPHYRKPNSFEKKKTRKLARTRLRKDLLKRVIDNEKSLDLCI